MRLNAFLPLVLIARSIQAVNPIRARAKQSLAYDEASTITSLIEPAHTNLLLEPTTLVQRFQPTLMSAAVHEYFNSDPESRKDSHHTYTEFEACKMRETDEKAVMDSESDMKKEMSMKVEQHHVIEDLSFPYINRLTTRLERGSRKTLFNSRDIADDAESDCSGKVSGRYKTATVALGVIVGLEAILAVIALLWFLFSLSLIARIFR
jgi:hypothetical protein